MNFESDFSYDIQILHGMFRIDFMQYVMLLVFWQEDIKGRINRE